MRTLGALVAGPFVWLLSYGVLTLLYAVLVGVSPNSRFGMAFVVYFGAAFAAGFAFEVMRRISPQISLLASIGSIGAFAALWLGGAVAVAPDPTELSFRITSVVVALLGIISCWAILRRSA